MGCYREKTSSLFARFAPQTSLSTSFRISSLGSSPQSHFHSFELPDELILPIVFHISPELIGHYARFRVQDELAVYDDHRQGAGSTMVKYDMQDDAVAIATMDTGTP